MVLGANAENENWDYIFLDHLFHYENIVAN